MHTCNCVLPVIIQRHSIILLSYGIYIYMEYTSKLFQHLNSINVNYERIRENLHYTYSALRQTAIEIRGYFEKKDATETTTVDEWKTNLMSLAILFPLLCAQHVSDINISIFRSLRLCWWITTSVVLFSVRCVLELLVQLVFGGVRFAGFSLQNCSSKIHNSIL